MFKRFRSSALIATVLLCAQCSTVEKAPLQSNSTSSAIEDIAGMAGELQTQQVDFLATEEFNAGLEDLAEARSDMKEGDEKDEVMESLGMAKAHFIEAKEVASKRRKKVNKSILDARRSATSNGMSKPELKEQLATIDSDYRDETDLFSEELEVEATSKFQTRYNQLETASVVARETGMIETVINQAEENDAEDLAPNTLKDARTSLTLAKNQIQHNPRDPSNYDKQVLKANKSAKLLKDVMSKLTGDAKGSPEHVARKLVFNDRKIGALSDTINTVSGSLQETRSNLKNTSQNLSSAKQELAYEQTMEKIRKDIPTSAAEVYRQGSNLIVRLKDIDFPVGSAKVPNDAKELITKLQSTLTGVSPTSIEVQGHTDSQGSDTLNKKLSLKRAEAVSALLATNDPSYKITTNGFGESKPLVSNNTKKGRRTNRRVDLVVTTR